VPTWGEVEKEIFATRTANGAPDFDGVRRKYLRRLAEYTKRSCIVYATPLSPPSGVAPSDISISLDPDVQAFMEVVHGLPRDVPLDLMLHSPGGSAEAAEAIIDYLRGRFPGLRVIVPVAAMSAATMMSMAADEIVMGAHSQLGPIDPQLTISTPEGPRSAPAAAIREQFDKAAEDLAQHPERTGAWLPILRSMSPALLQICVNSEALAKDMVKTWLAKYMLNDLDAAERAVKAEHVADELSAYGKRLSHARRVGRDELRALGLRVVDLEADQDLQDRVLTVHHCVDHTMNHTGTLKLVENHMGKAYVRLMRLAAIGVGPAALTAPGAPPPGALPAGPQLPGAAGGGSRQQRRRAERDSRRGRGPR
jgi:Serine dehydrogenase proteinase